VWLARSLPSPSLLSFSPSSPPPLAQLLLGSPCPHRGRSQRVLGLASLGRRERCPRFSSSCGEGLGMNCCLFSSCYLFVVRTCFPLFSPFFLFPLPLLPSLLSSTLFALLLPAPRSRGDSPCPSPWPCTWVSPPSPRPWDSLTFSMASLVSIKGVSPWQHPI
jgi:hypothetical protein